MMASIFDAIFHNTVATGNWQKGKVPKPVTYPRPDDKTTADKKKKVSVRDLWNRFTANGFKGGG